MKRWILPLFLLCLAGCGIESAGTAATAASLKAKEVQQAQEMKEQVSDNWTKPRNRPISVSGKLKANSTAVDGPKRK